MLVEKLLNNGMTMEIVKYMIDNSIKSYNTNMRLDMTLPENRNIFLSFISDDIYEFDCISCFSKLMIDMNINVPFWQNVSAEVLRYNSYISQNESIYKTLSNIMKYCDGSAMPQTNNASNEYKFIHKILTCSHKNGINLKQTKFQDINKKINLIETKLSSDFPNNVSVAENNLPIVVLKQNEIAEIPLEIVKNYYDKNTQQFVVPITKQLYNIFHKFIGASDVRKKIDDAIYNNYQKNIPKLTYLFIYKHVKANMLGYNNYLEFITHHSSDKIQNILQNIIVALNNRCNLELDILAHMKHASEQNNALNTWDIAHYINKWKISYGIDETEISPYFELNNTISHIMQIIPKIFPIQFSKVGNSRDSVFAKYDVSTYKITYNGIVVGSVILDMFSRDNKITSAQTVCINNRCNYPFEKKLLAPIAIILSMNLQKTQPTLLSLSELTTLFNEFGKIIYYVSCSSTYSLFGGMYSNSEMVDMLGKFMELIMFNNSCISAISKHHVTGHQMPVTLVNKVLHHRKLDYGITYKYQCLYGLYDLFVHSQIDFINNCKSLMRIENIAEQKERIMDCMYEIYNTFYETIFNVGQLSIHKDPKHFHPIMWSYLFNGSENVNFLKILSDISAHDLYQLYTANKSKLQFCTQLLTFISQSTTNEPQNIEEFTHRPLSHTHMLEYFGLNENDSLLSLYNINKKSPPKPASKKPVCNDKVVSADKHASLYLSPDAKKIPTLPENHFEQISDNDPNIVMMLNKVTR